MTKKLTLEQVNKKIDDIFLVKFSTAVTHLIGIPNHDSMAGKYYARFHVKHEDHSDSYFKGWKMDEYAWRFSGRVSKPDLMYWGRLHKIKRELENKQARG